MINLETLESNLFTPDQAFDLIESILKKSQSEGVFVSLNTSESALSRFSENQITQNLHKKRFKLRITSYFGQKKASCSTTEIEPDAIEETLKRSEELARFAPEDPEWIQLLEPQNYEVRIPIFDQETFHLSPLKRGEMIAEVTHHCKQAGVEGSGTLSTDASVVAIGNSLGLQAYNRTTEADFSFTAKINDGSSWSNRTAWGIGEIPLTTITQQVIQRAIASQNPRDLKPGVYPVIMEAAALSNLLPWVIWNLDARAADEGRSFMSRNDETGKPIGNRLGEALFSPLVQVQRNAAHPLLQLETFFEDGLSNNYREIIKDGITQTLSYSRYWAKQQEKEATGFLTPIIMTGSNRNLSDLIRETQEGILVSRAWYVRYINPRTLEVTGMTRDGTFWIENGEIAYPIKNLRFNQSLPEMLKNITDLAEIQRFGSTVVPGVKIDAFNFSSVTDSI
jgi:predicted Zn-dependent protease